MNKRLLKKIVAVFATVTMLFINVSSTLAANKENGFPLPTNRTYGVSVLSRYSNGDNHDIYLYKYGPLKGQSENKNIIMDIMAPFNTPIYAVDSGTIYTNKYGSGGGNYLVIAHGDGSYSYYGHMKNQSSYGVGSHVNVGDIVGYVGNTGSATGYHLHFEWSKHDPYCDFKSKGYVYTYPNSGASAYPHTHNSQSGSSSSTQKSYTAYPKGTDGMLNIRNAPKTGKIVGSIPENAACTVNPNKGSGNWYWVTYNGVSGYSYSKYLTKTKPVTASKPASPSNSQTASTYTAYPKGTDGTLNIRSAPKTGKIVGSIPEGAACTVTPSKNKDGWCYVTYNGVSGYSSGNYFSKSKPSSGGTSSNTRTGVVRGADGYLNINSKPASGNSIGKIPEGKSCTVYPDKTSGNWYWVSYNGVSGYAHSKYIILQ